MAKVPKREDQPRIEEEPSADERFERAVERALNTPPKHHADMVKKGRPTPKKVRNRASRP